MASAHSIPPATTQVNATSDKAPPLILVDDLIRAIALDENQVPLLYFAKSERGVTDFEGFTGKDLDRFVDHAAKFYMDKGLKPVSHVYRILLKLS